MQHGQEHEMSVDSYPTWSASNSHEHRAVPSADGKHNHWWPSQAYHCTYCPRVFRTAQALGGHMNIHRRERAFENDPGNHFHSRQGDSHASSSIPSRSSNHPAPTVDQLRSSLFSISPPAPCPKNCKEYCSANRRTAVTSDSATHAVTTANFFAPTHAAGMNHRRVGWNNGGDAGKFEGSSRYRRVGWNGGDDAKFEESSRYNTSDPLSWLFSQLPPPGSVSTQQREQAQAEQNWQQQQQCRGGNILMQKNLAIPYHRAVAVRGGVGYPSPPFPEQSCLARGRSAEAGGSRNGEQEDGDGELDLELRL